MNFIEYIYTVILITTPMEISKLMELFFNDGLTCTERERELSFLSGK